MCSGEVFGLEVAVVVIFKEEVGYNNALATKTLVDMMQKHGEWCLIGLWELTNQSRLGFMGGGLKETGA